MRTAFEAQFDVPDGYLNTASIGVPPENAAQAVAEAVHRWSRGASTPQDFEEPVTRARTGFAALTGVDPQWVALGCTVSQMIGLVAASVPDGTRVLTAQNDFTSVAFPFAAQEGRGVRVTEVDVAELPAHAGEHDLVAVSVVQSSDGRLVDLAGLRRAAESGTAVLLDATQALGWLPLELEWVDWVVAASYKFLMAPRGAAWMAVHPRARYAVHPHAANWYAGEDPWETTYGLPLRLASTARRLDVSPAWLAQVGAGITLPWLAELDRAAVHQHCVGLADRLREGVGMTPAGSAIVSLEQPGAGARLAAAGVHAASRNGRTRLSFHLYNTARDVDLVLEALRA